MTVLANIITAWRNPRALIRSKLDQGVREDRALAVIMGAGMLAFVAQTPVMARASHLDAAIPMDARLGGALMACLFFLPLLAYLLGLISHWIAKLFGGRGTGFGARLALFWSFLAVTPAMMIQGLVQGFLGHGTILNMVQLFVIVGFLVMWLNMLYEASQANA